MINVRLQLMMNKQNTNNTLKKIILLHKSVGLRNETLVNSVNLQIITHIHAMILNNDNNNGFKLIKLE